MAIVAHPDDIEYSYAGTFARWAKAGTRISYVICTSGEVGIAAKGMTRARAAEIRQAEQRDAAKIVGAVEVVFLGEPDGLLQPTLELRKKLVREIRRFRPEVIVTGDPTVVWSGDDYINHPDHRAASAAAVEAAFPAAGQPNLFEDLEQEGLKAHKVRKVYSRQWNGAVAIDIEETIETKIAALRAHVSQMNGDDPSEKIKSWAAEAAEGKGFRYAEVFHIVTLVSDEDWAKKKGAVLEE